MDRALAFVAERQPKADRYVEVTYPDDYPLVLAQDDGEFSYAMEALDEQGLLETPGTPGLARHYRVTPEGWAAMARIRESRRDSNQAFVAMWFDPELDPVWLEGFKPALENYGFVPMRVDRVQHNQRIDDFIVAEIRRSGLVVADFTKHRQGVYFEAGFALGLGIPLIWTCRKDELEKAHFDTRQYNHIDWETPEDLRVRLEDRIAATVPGRASAMR